MAARGGASGGQQQQQPLGSAVKRDGSTVIAATQRPDGSWRREIRVRDGFAPRDEMAPYRPPLQREAAQQKQQQRYPVGWDPNLAAGHASEKGGQRRQQSSKPSSKPKPEAKAPPSVSVETVAAAVGGLRVSEPAPALLEGEVLARRVKALQKKLRQIEELEARVAGGGGDGMESLTPEQREKLGRKAAMEDELRALQSMAQ